MKQFDDNAQSNKGPELSDEGHLSVGGGHKLHYIRTGTKGGLPLIVCHGGPGAWLDMANVKRFENSHYDVIVYSQRGCGLSKRDGEPLSPNADASDDEFLRYYVERAEYICQENSIPHLIDDVEAIRSTFFGDQKMTVMGGSFGGALAQLYAMHYPDQTSDLILRSSSLTKLRGRMNPEDKAVTDLERLKNPCFRDFEDRVKGLVGEDDYVPEKLFDHMNDILQSADFTYEDKADVTLLWRMWNKTNHTTRMTPDVARQTINGDKQENIRYGFVFAKLHQDYKRYGVEYFKQELSDLSKKNEDLLVFIVHGLGDNTCPIDSAVVIMNSFSGENIDASSLKGGDAVCAKDGRSVLFPVDSGHASDDSGMAEQINRALEAHYNIRSQAVESQNLVVGVTVPKRELSMK